ncbi:MAG TPA: YdcF family protein [Alphaproteobacteria bacterium]|jgi:uncharacterized SAM-binding protein YcdF (DUF218 family)
MSFLAGKAAWVLLRPSTLLALMLALGLLLRALGRRRTGRGLVGVALAAFLACAVLPVGAWLLSPLENRFAVPALPERVDGIIVLGGAIEPALSADRQALSLNGNAERLVAFAALARRYPAAKLVFTGGSGNPLSPDLREGDWIGEFLDAASIARERVVVERESRNTDENARLSKALVKPQPGEVWVMVTSARHMPRAVGIFRKAGWTVVPYPADYLTTRAVGANFHFNLAGGLAALDAAAYEWFGLAYYRLSGRIDAWLPRP